jgi:hypothetical protein
MPLWLAMWSQVVPAFDQRVDYLAVGLLHGQRADVAEPQLRLLPVAVVVAAYLRKAGGDFTKEAHVVEGGEGQPRHIVAPPRLPGGGRASARGELCDAPRGRTTLASETTRRQ